MSSGVGKDAILPGAEGVELALRVDVEASVAKLAVGEHVAQLGRVVERTLVHQLASRPVLTTVRHLRLQLHRYQICNSSSVNRVHNCYFLFITKAILKLNFRPATLFQNLIT